MPEILVRNIEKQIRALTEGIGVRLAGSAGEKRAVEYIATELKGFGADVQVEDFRVRERAVQEEHLEVCAGGQWRRAACSLLSNACGTDGKLVEAPLVFFSAKTDYRRPDLSFLSGKAVVHLGNHIETADDYRRLVQAGPAFVLFVDARYPGTVVTADGMFPAYARIHGPLPIVSVAYMDAWQWREQGATGARLRVAGGMRESSSSNVIAELPGTDPAAGVALLGAHHDTQADSAGADDNAVGVAILLETVRALAGVKRRRTLRCISFGAEEQLSVGSAAYVRRHREELTRNGVFMLNFDACASLLGWTELLCCGPEPMAPYVNRFFRDRGEYVAIKNEVVPYADHFPFLAAGIPSVWVSRSNCAAGRFFHHRPDDTLSRVDCSLAARLAEIGCECLCGDPLPFPGRLPPGLQADVGKKWQELFGGWTESGA